MDRIVVISGANRGIGREAARQFVERRDTVVVTARRADQAGEVAAELNSTAERERAVARRLDVTDQESIVDLATDLEDRFGRVDVLVNNAGIHYDDWQSAVDADLDVVREALETNLFGAWMLSQHLLPLLRAARHGRIVNVSSELGSLAVMGGGAPAYKVSKVGLNALTRMLADELAGDGILVNSVCPGWTATDMGGPGGRPVAEGAAGIVWAADLPDGGPTGGLFRDGQPLPW
ncbi:SDR family NAD(P)-dependent oxidoreductase [Planosporangium mesophilum]|uniref:Short-chain dehydrogenase n=1 Tax=Planosporangium mesophilum TaxID=689768 RepID=A0A8J3TDQ6_9ACTN|nr:SDR family NAD(P)-dependent oxidoreductase [Planosporangium mesophilum]NJC84062.1 SDR family NAD(P)-dependent oxidoreductase [Planosporangium mesophilum]GII22934.1 short-chain dehydrogenase [Planosporangium mesophilum]